MNYKIFPAISCIILLIPIALFSGVQILSDFESITPNNWQGPYTDGGAIASNFQSSSFHGNYSIEFVGNNMQNWNNAIWKWIIPSAANWSNYGKLIFSMKPENVLLTNSDPNNNLNFGLTIKEPWGDSNWDGQVWEYYIPNNTSTITQNKWYLFETDLSHWGGLTNGGANFNTRFNKWRDANYSLGLDGNLFPPRGVRELDIFYKTANLTPLFNQRIAFDFLAIISTPYAQSMNQTNYFPMNLAWNDVAANHPIYQIQIVTNTTNSSPIIRKTINNADSISSYTFDAVQYPLKPYHKYLWHTRSGYVVNSANGFYSGAFKKFNLDYSQSDISANSSVTLWSYFSTWAGFSNKGIPPFNNAYFSPTNNGFNYGVSNVAFQWQNLSQAGADSYIFSISSNKSFSKIITTKTLSSTNYLFPSAGNFFTAHSNYYYYVRAGFTNYQGNLIWDKSRTNLFTFSFIAPALMSPVTGYIVANASVNFQWANAYSGVTYVLEISSDSGFSSIISSTSYISAASAIFTFDQNKFINKQNYYWRVKAISPIKTLYSPVNQFYLNIQTWNATMPNIIKVYPTMAQENDSINVLFSSTPGKTVDHLKILFFNTANIMVASQIIQASQIPATQIINLSLPTISIKKGFYLIYIVSYYTDNSISKSPSSPLIIK